MIWIGLRENLQETNGLYMFVPYLPSQKRGVEMKPPNNIAGFG